MNEPTKTRILELRSMPYEKYLKTSEWKQKRDQALERDGHCCRACNSDERLNVHHKTYARRGNEALNDLTTLCESCHRHFHEKISQQEIMDRTYQEPLIATSKEDQTQKWENYFVGMLIQHQDLPPYVCGLLSEQEFATPDARMLYALLVKAASSDQSFDQLVTSDLEPVVSRIVELFKSKNLNEKPVDANAAIQLATWVKRANLLRRGEELQILVEEAVKADDKAKELELRKEAFTIQKRLCVIYTTTRL